MQRSTVPTRRLFPPRALMLLIVPLILEQFLAMTVGLADTVMVTSVGEAAVSGVALVDTFNNLIIAVLAALCTGGAIVCAQYLGRQEPQNASRSAKQLLYIALLFSVVVAALILSVRRTFIRLVFGSVSADVFENALIYLTLTTLSFPFLALYNACAALFRSMGNSRVPLLASIIVNIVNVGGNAILIYGCGWGVAGAGTATLVSRFLAAVIMLSLIRNHNNAIYLDHLLSVRFERGIVKSILRVAIPSGFENGLFHVGKLLVQSVITSLGTVAIAANAIVNSISSVLIVPGSALGLALITVVGQCVGANDYAQAKYYTRRLTLFGMLAMGAINLPLLVLAEPIVGLFHLSADATAIVLQILPLLTIVHTLIWPLSFEFPNALRAAGDAKYTMTVSIISMWICRVGMSYVLVYSLQLGVPGVWLSMYADWVVRTVCFLIRYVRGKWMQKRVIS